MHLLWPMSQDKYYRRLFRFIRQKNEKKGWKRNKESVQDSRDCWPMNSNDSVWLDPLHLPRAPILQHNVSLCHGRSTPLYSPSAAPAASPVAWSRVYGILDFGNPNSTAEYRSRRSSIGEETHRGGWTETVFQHAFPLWTPPSLPSLSGWSLSFLGISPRRFLNQRANPRCNLGWVVKILSLLWCDNLSELRQSFGK